MASSHSQQHLRKSLATDKFPVEIAARPFFNRFPLEIKLQILSYLLVCPEPLSFTREQFSSKKMPKELENAWREAHCSRILRLCRWNHWHYDEPEALALKSDFSALCLASKQMRCDARNIFFARNRWVLHVTPSFDAVKWVLTYWGREAACLMTNVRIELQCTRRPERCYKAIERFVDVVKDGNYLRNLSVQWISGSEQNDSEYPLRTVAAPHVTQISRDLGLERNSDGGRGRAVGIDPRSMTPWLGPESERPDWARREVLLQPLQNLRGIKHVRIEGTVTESWAQYLEMAMNAVTGTVIPEFEFQPEAEDALNKLI